MSVRNSALRSFRRNADLVSVRRDRIDSNSLQAFVIGYSTGLVLLQYIYDFHVDGHLLIRRGDITQIESRATDRFQRRMLDEERILATIDFDYAAPIATYKDFLEFLPSKQIVILEDDSPDEPQFLIGTIHSTTDDVVSLNYFSGAGNWDTEPVEMRFSQITSCQTDTNYINFYARHFERTAVHSTD